MISSKFREAIFLKFLSGNSLEIYTRISQAIFQEFIQELLKQFIISLWIFPQISSRIPTGISSERNFIKMTSTVILGITPGFFSQIHLGNFSEISMELEGINLERSR